MESGSLNLGWVSFASLPSRWNLAVLGGRRPDPSWLKLAASGAEKVWAADAGVAYALAAGIESHRAIGDFDSLKDPQSIEWLAGHPERAARFPVEKDLTDFQIVLEEIPPDLPLVVTGFWGGRFDHLYCNVFSLMGWQGSEAVRVACDERECMALLGPRGSLTVSFDGEPAAVSLLALTEQVSGVRTDGLYWTPQPELKMTFPYTVSNKTTGRPFRVSLESGWLGVYLCSRENALVSDR
ncbi:thiamine pyrophosphokinase [Jonquetella anthropi DSM 22815]|uniref:Thiamine diphosphokinase n=1 Tax=Jonquetella anthropi DSM 22815 TaxID=885272 RepID=H0UK87_9BACT|nr:thiamine diphosphokinase [Jonquetella anthropi]EHM13096.1 thiamine pyrophosphokinase [Jonquetella anthropi DSM 22815]